MSATKMTDGNVPSRQDLESYFQTLSNWGRWGADDQLGTLNLITPDVTREAAGLVTEGRHLSCARQIGPRSGGSGTAGSPLHFMISSGESAPAEGLGGATDWFGMAFHGNSVTHLDAPSHIFWNGRLYNGVDARRVTTSRGALAGSVDVAGTGIVARGILADVPRHRGTAAVSDRILTQELVSCLTDEQVQPRPGDVLIVRTGRDAREHADWEVARPGLHAECLPWLRANDISVLVGDGAQEVQPSGYTDVAFPIHAIGIVAMGLWLLDNAYLEELAAACAERRRWEFLFLVAPLRLKNTTGSPVNPIAIL